jgi:long-chain acyl-CoA synthetase
MSADFRGYERPRRCALLDEDFSCENGLLTPTLKLKRTAAIARYKEAIAKLYTEAELERSARA